MESVETQKKRILFVITKSNWGGAQRYVYDLAVAAKERGHAVAVAAGGDGELLTQLREADVPTLPVKNFAREVNLFGELRAFGELVRLMRKWRPDIVHLNSSKAGLAALAARFTGVPRIVFTVHGWAWNEDRSRLQKFLIACVYWLTLVLCDIAIVVSHAARNEARSLPFIGNRFRVVHNGVHKVEFATREAARNALLPESSRDFWIGTIAELHPIKNLPVLIEAFEHLAPDFPESELVIVGEGQERANLERRITIEGVSDTAHLVGHIPHAARYLKAFDMFVLPSHSESFGYVLLEAGLAGLPVIASGVGGIPEIIEHRVTGLLVPSDDREALTDALESLERDPELRWKLAAELRAKVEREFSLSRMVSETFALYEKNS